MRIGGTAGYEIRSKATSVKDDKPVTVVQWLRFGGGGTLRIIAVVGTREMAARCSRASAPSATASTAEIAVASYASVPNSATRCSAGAAFAPPFDTPTSAGRSMRSPIM